MVPILQFTVESRSSGVSRRASLPPRSPRPLPSPSARCANGSGGFERAGVLRSQTASAPARVSARLPEPLIALILHLRRSMRMTGAAIAHKLGLARSTVSRWLKRGGVGQLSRLDPPEPVRRYQRERPGELIHLDIKKLGRFDRPRHRITGTRTGCRNEGAGGDFVHVAIDDATRLAFDPPACG